MLQQSRSRMGLISHLSAALFLTSCGSGEFLGSFEGSGASDEDMIQGVVTGFGSIFVNGREIITDGADFEINDSRGEEADLAVGQIVTLRTSEDQNGTVTAEDVTYDPEVLDQIISIEVETNQFSTSIDLIEIDGGTIFTNGALSDLSVDDYVEVSGFRKSDNSILATFVSVITNPANTEIKGIVTDLDTAASSFMLANISVDYSTASLEPSDLQLSNGQSVEIRGNLLNSTFTASSVELEQGLSLREDQRLELEGLVKQITSLNEFQLADVAVIINENTSYLRGNSADLQNNSRLEVIGSVNADGQLVASQIEFRPDPNISIAASVDQVSLTNNFVTVLGRQVTITDVTTFTDRVLLSNNLGLGDIQVGDWIDLRGYEFDSELAARHVIRTEAAAEIAIQGPVSTINTNQQSIILAGITVDTASSGFNLSEVSTGDFVEISGAFTNGELIADTITPIN